MDEYNKELQKIAIFMKENEELVGSALNLVAISIMKILNDFNRIESNLTTLIANYYKISYSPELDFRADVLDTGHVSFGSKVNILGIILEKSGYCQTKSKELKECLGSLKTIGDLRNNIVHSVYGIDPERTDGEKPEMIIYANGKKISKKDLLDVFSSFEKYSQKSDTLLNDVFDYLKKKEVQNVKGA